VPPNEDEIEPAILNQIRYQRIERYFDFQQYKIPEVWQTSFETRQFYKKTLSLVPANLKDLYRHKFEKDFKKAMEVHLRQYKKEFNSWTSVPLIEAKEHQVLNCQWIFVYKTDKYN